MNKKSTREKATIVQNNFGWGRVLQDAEVALLETKARGRAIKRSMRAIQAKMHAGEPLPEYVNPESTNN